MIRWRIEEMRVSILDIDRLAIRPGDLASLPLGPRLERGDFIYCSYYDADLQEHIILWQRGDGGPDETAEVQDLRS